MRWLRRWACLALVALAACGDDATAPAGDAAADVAGSADVGVSGDGGTADVQWGPQDADVAADAGRTPDAGGGWACPEPADGSPGCPCEGNGDCQSGYCVPTAEGLVCSETCVETCPSGWSCAAVTNAGADATYICLPLYTKLCRPCATGADCAQDGGLGGYCLAAKGGAGSFCGGPCGEGRTCPAGYSCEDVDPLGDGKAVPQCVPVSGECACSALSIKEGAATPCSETNGHGTCEGTRSCGPAGLGECTARVPDAESCNGQDDDCDGETDEALEEGCTAENEHGICGGTRICEGGKWSDCDAPEPAADECNGLDDDCDGLADEGFDDTDGDGDADCVDSDDDADGVPDESDNCAVGPNADQTDSDGDGLGDACDEDDDGDGLPDAEDCAPTDPEVGCTVYLWDADGDGAPESCAKQKCLCAPQDKYTVVGCGALDCDDADPSAAPGLPEVCDGVDNDCDGAVDDGEPDGDGDGVMDACDPDLDGDGVPNEQDNCPLVADPGQKDLDGDGLGDACDEDDDGEGVPDGLDNCPQVPNPGQEDADLDGAGDACDGDQDGDGVPDDQDGCPQVADPDQEDTDGDGAGDACDEDDDGDGDPDETDCAPLDPAVHVGADEVCDGADQDCDGDVDDGFAGLGLPCDGDDADQCKEGLGVCAADGLSVTCEEAGAPAVETCNGVDDDCDGAVDEGFPGLGDPCDGDDDDLCATGLGVCAPDGGGVACDEPGGGLEELCNGADDDCDGAVDEGFPGLGDPCDGDDPDTCATGVVACATDGLSVTCQEAGAPKAEACNGLDDDCDGAVDEGYAGLGDPCDGADADLCATGVVACSPDGGGVVCDEPGPGAIELCNGVDDDCDGAVDEGYAGLGAPCDGDDADLCATGVGACSPDGGGVVCDEPGPGAIELCNGADDDCDGAIDEGYAGLGDPCDGDDADLCATGILACAPDGDGVTCDEPGPGAVESCNGADDDCDGAVDEGFPGLGDPCDGDDADLCESGTVVCASDGGGVACDEPGPGAVELCNGADDDCDGAVDEGFPGLGLPCDGDDDDLCATGVLGCAPDGGGVACDEPGPGAAELCNGADDDCDGAVDEGFPGLGDACDGDDADLCATGTVVCADGGLAATCDEAGAGSSEDCTTPGDDDCDGLVNEGCRPASFAITPFSVVLPAAQGPTWSVEAGAGEPGAHEPAAGPGWSVDFGFYPTVAP